MIQFFFYCLDAKRLVFFEGRLREHPARRIRLVSGVAQMLPSKLVERLWQYGCQVCII
jgi:hypothetical protein